MISILLGKDAKLGLLTLLPNLRKNYAAFSRASLLLFISACGKSRDNLAEQNFFDGLDSAYVPLKSDYEEPTSLDKYFRTLAIDLEYPYWVDALEMDNGKEEIDLLLMRNDNIITFTFPKIIPDYMVGIVNGWGPATTEMQDASREIFFGLSKVLDIKIEERDEIVGMNNIAISRSKQSDASGISFFPNNSFFLGSDLFISSEYDVPLFISKTLTNYNYEVLVHEIGHSLGLKHPFEADRSNHTILNDQEDQTAYTAMSYNEDPNTFSGTFRSLDWMTLTKFYGVNPEFNSGNDIYFFSDTNATFIVDGGGTDIIDSSGDARNVFIDLREGSHSHCGYKSQYITDNNQLSISYGSTIENVLTGMGQDQIIGNAASNEANTGGGDDRIYLGEGSDTYRSGPGYDLLDLSELEPAKDTIVIAKNDVGKGFDTVYGFTQGVGGDTFNMSQLITERIELLPVVGSENVPYGFISNHIIRVVDGTFSSKEAIKNAFTTNGVFSNFQFIENKLNLGVASKNQETGSDQLIFTIQQSNKDPTIEILACLKGNYLDIDIWSDLNFQNPIDGFII